MRKLNKAYWKKFTNDKWILDIVHPGYKIEFFEAPYEKKIPKQIHFNEAEFNMVSIEVQTLIDKGAIEEVGDISDFSI